MDGSSQRKQHALELFEALPARYDTLSAALSFWQDPRWRRALVDSVEVRSGERVLDVATGTGMVALELRSRCDCAVLAVDQSSEMLAAARARFDARGDRRVQLMLAEAEHLPFPDASFDALTVTYLLRYVDDPAATVAELARVLRPGGRIASLEFGVPGAAPARWLWNLYTRIGLPALGALVSPAWRDVGAFLGPSIRGFYERHPPEQIARYWLQAGLVEVQSTAMSFGAGVLMRARRA